ncbi:HAMP domain-containing protein [Acidaminobacter sp. JC074]|uniref:methyl-accepting chemotaxis protein n=1 Tax=Acidaminobacter sp. JC074 TaxID=2530199 RepID=UPI001F0E9795|nr:methyl-accepting chemotaxis protein [Acidaminobacter sp. JC074]MCH4888037.1 HAMP domain-containing protein [Acidaminobacter sp. JC074]
MKLLQKLLLIILSLILITSLAIGIFSYYKASTSTNDLMMSKVGDQLKLRTELIEEKIANTQNTISLISNDKRIMDVLSGGSKAEATEACTTTQKQYSELISLVSVVDKSNAVLIADEKNAGVVGADLSQRDYIKDAMKTKKMVVSDLIVSKASGSKVIAICQPYFIGNEYQGSVVATIDFALISDVVSDTKIGTKGYGYMIDITGDNAGTFVAHINNEYVEDETSMFSFEDKAIHAVANNIINKASGSEYYTFDGVSKYAQYVQVENWGFVITADESDLNATSISIRNVMIITIIIGIIASSLISYFLVKNIITQPITQLEKAMSQAGAGNLNVDVQIHSKDEIGSLSRSFMKMIDSLKDVLTTINIASEQVLTGSQQLSDSSMSLSQGATEQAASIEELTATIEQISVQTEQNAQNANNTKRIVDEAKIHAETGNKQMDEMLQSMAAIDESSNNISKIIKVIDDIAFQTNILALNAAVEAARAGEHGKGFAVVAEEVRNLAAQSADAAKETTVLIEGSIEKVKDGTTIANDTAESLKKIVDEINSTTTLVTEIAEASSEQAYGVNQINDGITQISAVVQTTSATAEETAAASEELSGQAAMLQSKVATFKL